MSLQVHCTIDEKHLEIVGPTILFIKYCRRVQEAVFMSERIAFIFGKLAECFKNIKKTSRLLMLTLRLRFFYI